MLRRCLHDQTLPIEVRAAGTLILLFGRTTTTFADLTVADLEQNRGETYLRLGDFTALLPPPAAAVFHTLSEDATTKETFQQPDNTARYLFPGRFPADRPRARHQPQAPRPRHRHPAIQESARAGGPATSPAPSPPTYSESTSALPPNGPAARVATGPTTSPNAHKHWSEMTANAGTEGPNTAPCQYRHVTMTMDMTVTESPRSAGTLDPDPADVRAGLGVVHRLVRRHRPPSPPRRPRHRPSIPQ